MPDLIKKLLLSFTFILVLPLPLCPAAIIDFTESSHENRIWKLDGSWDFYWQELLNPESEPQQNPIPIAAGRPWNGQIHSVAGKSSDAFGYGTYERRLKGLAWQPDGYEFGIASASSAYRAYLYPLHDPTRFVTIGNGLVGSTKDSTIPNILPQFVHFFPSGPDEVWVVRVQVANFHDSKGGLWTLPTLSLKNASSQMFHMGIALSMAASGMALVIAFYNFMLYYRRREDKPSLLLALFCLIVCARNLATADIYSYLDQRQEAWIYHMKWFVEYISILSASWCLAAFYFFAFETNKSSRTFHTTSVLTALAILSILALPVHQFTRLLTVYQIICGLSTYYVISMMIKCLLQKRDGARLLLLGGIIFVLSSLYDVGVAQGLLPLPYTNQFATVVFIFLYSQLIAARFSKAFRTSERLQRSLREEVALQTAEIRNVMDHIPQGIFVIDQQLRIKGQYARFLEDLFGKKDLSGQAALDLMFEKSQDDKDIQSRVQSCLFAGMGEDLLFWELNHHLLPREIHRRSNRGTIQTLELNWHPIVDKQERVSEVLVSLRDVTELKQLQKQSAEDRLQNDMILELIALKPGFFDEFWSYSTALVEKLSPYLNQKGDLKSDTAAEVLQQIHAWKGLSRAANFRVLTDAIHDLESRIQALRHADQKASCSLSELWTRILDLLERYQKQTARIHQHSHGIDSKEHRTILLSEILGDFHRDLTSLAQELNIPPPRLVLPTLDFWVSVRASMALKVALIQLGRNSLVHGIQPPAQRLAQGKSREGTIHLDYEIHPEREIVLRYRDDGAGLSLKKIAAKAYERKLVAPDHPISEDDAVRLIMTSEFSTADQVSQLAGRGVGMMAIAQSIEQLGGSFEVRRERTAGDEPGHVPVAFVIVLPAALFEPVPGLLRSS